MRRDERVTGAWHYEIQYGPEGEANYAWLYRGAEMVATMKTHHAAALTAALEVEQPVAVEVKKLEWQGDGELYAFADVTQKAYSISFEEGKYWANWDAKLPAFPTLEAAKAAAQQDYETRIRSAIVGVPVTGWQPIETAPKDGTKIIATGKCGVRVVWWGAGAFNRKINAYDRDWTDCVTYGFKLTHWQPLPAAPTTRTADSAEAGGSATLSSGGPENG